MQQTQIPLGHQEASGDCTVHTFLDRLPKAIAKPRAVLTKSQAINIFQLKHKSLSATKVARSNGVSEKTVRDIWTARTWASETWHLDPSRAIKIKQHTGRPLGSRDSKPRKPRQASVGGFAQSSTTLICHQITMTSSDDDHPSEASSDGADMCEANTENVEAEPVYPERGEQLECSAEDLSRDCESACIGRHPFAPTTSLDDQLFDWERWQSGTWLDPFEADSLQGKRTGSHGPNTVFYEPRN
jgi:hypothetical protein